MPIEPDDATSEEVFESDPHHSTAVRREFVWTHLTANATVTVESAEPSDPNASSQVLFDLQASTLLQICQQFERGIERFNIIERGMRRVRDVWTPRTASATVVVESTERSDPNSSSQVPLDIQIPTLLQICQQLERGIERFNITQRGMRRVRDNMPYSLLPVSHRCQGYRREEVILGPSLLESVVLTSSNPTANEICFLCGEKITETYSARYRLILNNILQGAGRNFQYYRFTEGPQNAPIWYAICYSMSSSVIAVLFRFLTLHAF
jgi:hypothetical protein